MGTYLIYKHTSPSGKSYIGQTKNIAQRNAAHKIPSSKCRAFVSAIQKYGWDAFVHEILVQGLTLEEANQCEEALIEQHNTMYPTGYNLRSGGQNQLISEEVKRKWSDQRKGRQRTPEHQEKLNAAARNRIRSPEHTANLMEAVKRKRSDATRRRMSEAGKGKIKSDEHRARLSAANRGRVQSEERKAKVQAKKIGRRLFVHHITGERKYFYPDQFTTIPLDIWNSVT